jgi:hypothetical protein
MSHNFMTGAFKKKNPTSADIVKFFHSATVPQLNILHEISSQHLQHPPSGSWGYQKIPWRFQAEPETWNYLRQASRQPVHEFARKMTDNTHVSKKASGLVSNIVEGISDAGKYAWKYGSKAASLIIKHKDDIATGIKIAKDAAQLGSTIAVLTGAISPDTHNTVTGVTNAISKSADKYKTKPKKGGWVDVQHLLASSYQPFEARAVKHVT